MADGWSIRNIEKQTLFFYFTGEAETTHLNKMIKQAKAKWKYNRDYQEVG